MSNKLQQLTYIVDKSQNLFDKATRDLFESYAVKLEENKIWKDDTQREIDSMMEEYFAECQYRGEDTYVEPPVTSMDYIEAVSENNGARFFEKAMNEELLALHEVQLIYSFKQVEISLKQFLLVQDEGIELKQVQRWDSLKKVLNQNGVAIGSLKSYSAINQLREVNNALKHSHEITDNVKKLNIEHFRDEQYFSPRSLSAFYHGIVGARKHFISEVAFEVGCSLDIPFDQLEHFKIEPEESSEGFDIPF